MTPKTKEYIRHLRANSTEAENRLWYFLRAKRLKGYKFVREHPIGPYIADFVCRRQKLIIELDGGQHADAVEYDKKRTFFLEKKGYQVLRFWNNDVLENMEGVLAVILTNLEKNSLPLPNPPPA